MPPHVCIGVCVGPAISTSDSFRQRHGSDNGSCSEVWEPGIYIQVYTGYVYIYIYTRPLPWAWLPHLGAAPRPLPASMYPAGCPGPRHLGHRKRIENTYTNPIAGRHAPVALALQGGVGRGVGMRGGGQASRPRRPPQTHPPPAAHSPAGCRRRKRRRGSFPSHDRCVRGGDTQAGRRAGRGHNAQTEVAGQGSAVGPAGGRVRACWKEEGGKGF